MIVDSMWSVLALVYIGNDAADLSAGLSGVSVVAVEVTHFLVLCGQVLHADPIHGAVLRARVSQELALAAAVARVALASGCLHSAQAVVVAPVATDDLEAAVVGGEGSVALAPGPVHAQPVLVALVRAVVTSLHEVDVVAADLFRGRIRSTSRA